jgi:hypothetical protein
MVNKKREKFLELANKRMTNALHQIELVGNLSNRSAYEYDKKDAAKIIKVLEESVADVKRRFNSPTGKQRPSFNLEDK